MTTIEVSTFAGPDAVVVLPLAAVEQHGAHLPLSTDLVIGRGILSHALATLPEGFPVRTLPELAVGASAEHLDFPGTLSLDSGSLIETIVDIGISVAACGIRRLVLSNSHGGNRASMDSAALHLRRDEDMLVVKASYPRFPRPEGLKLPASEWRQGLHGGAVETAMMMHLAPELVRMDAFEAGPGLGEELEGTLTHVAPEGAVSFGWLASDLRRDGTAGNAALAEVELGRALVEHYGRILGEVILDARAFPLSRLR